MTLTTVNTGWKADHCYASFREKTDQAPAYSRTSREHGLAPSHGSTVALEYPSQGHSEGGQHEAWLEIESSRPRWEYPKQRQAGGQGIPMEGGNKPPVPIKWNWHPCIRKSSINGNASRPTTNPHRMGHGFSLEFPTTRSMRMSRLARSRVA